MADSVPELDALVDAVVDQATSFAFLEALVADAETNLDEWENITIPHFLESALAWARDSHLSPTPTWRAFADILYAGQGYE
jgi:hypothetical protein